MQNQTENNQIALVNIETRLVRTIVASADIAPDWAPPSGYELVSVADLPIDFVYEGAEVEPIEDFDAKHARLLAEANEGFNIAVDNSDTRAQKKWKDYRKALRDVTNQATPDAVVWPEKPQ